MATAITAALVSELRSRTGAGMMDCKKALQEVHGDIQLAIEALRKSGRVKADKKAGRVAAEGAIVIRTADDGKRAVMVEVNSETDFVARDENFVAFVNGIATAALDANLTDVDALSALTLAGTSVEEARQALVAKVGENISVRRLSATQASAVTIGTYVHGNRIGVLVELDGDNPSLARDIAMHIAASKPLVISPSEVSKDLIDKEREIYAAQAAGSGKPQEIIDKMVNGRIKKYLDEVSLLGQPFVKDPAIQVEALLNKNRAKVLSFTRFEVGEGIEKTTEDFVEAVMSQVQGG